MEVEPKFLDSLKEIHNCVINFIDCEDKDESKYNELVHLLDTKNIKQNKEDLRYFFSLLNKIIDNHHRGSDFYAKIEQIIKIFAKEIIEYNSNSEIFQIFCNNKRVLLYLLEEKIFTIDEQITKQIMSKYQDLYYPQYFYPEIKPYLTNPLAVKKINDDQITEEFYQNRKNGYHEGKLCEFIRNDSIEKFIQYINETNLYLNSKIPKSIYETNNFLLEKEPTLIEYATFYEAIQIFKYLENNKVKLTSSLWLFAIHSNNAELINLLKDKKVDFDKITYLELEEESIKCHHNDLAKYIEEVYSKSEDLSESIIKYYNFDLMQIDMINGTNFIFFVEFGHLEFVKFLLDKEPTLASSKQIIMKY